MKLQAEVGARVWRRFISVFRFELIVYSHCVRDVLHVRFFFLNWPQMENAEELSIKASTAICKHWRRLGKCSYGEKCRFAHPEGMLKSRAI